MGGKKVQFGTTSRPRAKSPRSPRGGEQFLASIVGTQLAGSAGKEYTAYLLLVMQGERSWVVVRRYSQFHSLYGLLKKETNADKEAVKAAGRALPKKRMKNNLSPAAVSERHVQLQRFLNELLSSAGMQGDDAFVRFLMKDAQPVEGYLEIIDEFSRVCLTAADETGAHLSARSRSTSSTADLLAALTSDSKSTEAGAAEVAMAGALRKFHGSRWIQRHFQVRHNVLYKFNSQRDTHPRGHYMLVGAEVSSLSSAESARLKGGEKERYCFALKLPDGSRRVFSAKTPEIRARWVDALREAVTVYGSAAAVSSVIAQQPDADASESREPRPASSAIAFVKEVTELDSPTIDLLHRAVKRFRARRAAEVEPLVTFELNLAFLAVYNVAAAEKRVAILRALVACLPVENADALHRLVRFLRLRRAAVMRDSDEMKTTVTERLARMFGPGLITSNDTALASGQFDINAGECVAALLIDRDVDVFAADALPGARTSTSSSTGKPKPPMSKSLSDYKMTAVSADDIRLVIDDPVFSSEEGESDSADEELEFDLVGEDLPDPAAALGQTVRSTNDSAPPESIWDAVDDESTGDDDEDDMPVPSSEAPKPPTLAETASKPITKSAVNLTFAGPNSAVSQFAQFSKLLEEKRAQRKSEKE